MPTTRRSTVGFSLVGIGEPYPVVRITRNMHLMPNYDVILLAEDNEDHVLLTRRAFKMAGLLNPVFVVQDGEEAIAYLQGEGKFSNRSEYPLPTLLLLDLKMPRKNGFEVLEWLRGKPQLSALRVVVLTTSDQIHDVNRAYQLGANSFLTKPVDFRDFVQLSSAIKGYWLWMSRAPEVERPEILKSASS
jgi:CheY-like chemotaxis protein